jgi:hypothetical protein
MNLILDIFQLEASYSITINALCRTILASSFMGIKKLWRLELAPISMDGYGLESQVLVVVCWGLLHLISDSGINVDGLLSELRLKGIAAP